MEVELSTPSPSLAGKAVGMHDWNVFGSSSGHWEFPQLILSYHPWVQANYLRRNKTKPNQKSQHPLHPQENLQTPLSSSLSCSYARNVQAETKEKGWEHLNRLARWTETGGDRWGQKQGGPVMSWGQSHLWEERQLAGAVGKQEREATVRTDCRVSSPIWTDSTSYRVQNSCPPCPSWILYFG